MKLRITFCMPLPLLLLSNISPREMYILLLEALLGTYILLLRLVRKDNYARTLYSHYPRTTEYIISVRDTERLPPIGI